MTSGVQGEFYIGIVSSVGEDFKITANIPSVGEDFDAFPVRGDHDEPKKGDIVLLLSLDPQNHSYFTYWKLKENSFLGFRAYGKEISIDEDEIKISNYTGTYKDDEKPEAEKGSITLKKDGGIEIKAGDGKDIVFKVNGGNIKIEGQGKFQFPGTAMAGEAPGVFPTDVSYLPQGSPITRTNIIDFFEL